MTPWARAVLAVQLVAIDPAGLGGLWLRARSGPVRDRFMQGLADLPLTLRRLHPMISDEQLYGGLDLSATLASGQAVWQEGVLARGGALVLPMAERCPAGLAARLGAALDTPVAGRCLIALDEGAEPDETLPPALADRLALHLTLEDVPLAETAPMSPDWAALGAAIAGLGAVQTPPEALSDLTRVAQRLGVDSLRAPLLALRAARAHAALAGRDTLGPEDLTCAVEMVLAARATRLPAPEDSAEDPPPPEPEPEPEQPDSDPPDPGDDPQEAPLPLEDMLLEAAAALLPPDLLARMAAGRAARASKGASGAGAVHKGNRRGRPLPARAGRLDGQNRIDLIATLRAAAPWQTIRRRLAEQQGLPAMRLHVQGSDIRIRRYKEQSDRLVIFVVDASGSAAMARMAEAKGAVEMLLAEAYARRDHVALVAFRGTAADLLLPPTRSLVQTKRRLAALPGGGGTPLAAGLRTGLEVAHLARGRGMTPTLALLTDGRANIALDGRADRKGAAEDAEQMARLLCAQGLPALVIDTGARPTPPLRALAARMRAPYLPLPRADAGRLSAAVSAALEV